MKKILITSGGTREFLDEVRVLTNISSGKLGAMIAEAFLKENIYERHCEPIQNYEIHYVAPKNAIKPERLCGFFHGDEIHFHEITDVQSVYNIMQSLAPQMDVIIHAMAVSDFMFKPLNGKLKSNDPQEFIESLRNRIEIAPKILPMIKVWNPKCKLISFKFEVGIPNEKLLEIARESMKKGNSDIVIANDKQEMVSNCSHIAYAVHNDYEVKLYSKKQISEYILNYIERQK